MIHYIENEFFRIGVNTLGAELSVIESLKTHKSFLWNADPAVWANHSPVLFPIVGGLKNNSYHFQGNSYTLPRHGFIRNNQKIRLTEHTESSLTFGLTYDEDSLKTYPFYYEFEITYTLFASRIVVSYKVKNHGSGDMLFSLGAHPAFRCPLHENETYEDYYLEFEKPETDATHLLSKEGLLSGETSPVLNDTNILHLNNHLFDKDALIFKSLQSRQVSLRSTRSQQVITVQFEGFPYLGLWAKPNAHFICIEPWLGIADRADTDQDFEKKEGILTLKSKHIFTAAYSIEITE
ncbi:Protein LacX, plasmid [Dyadobacter sp. CECT 9275]|uniref:Protein LacX, plasmid n=1 Tax=Dyadobacter helix TaxID=2822344 RepID=A0A916JGG7_9BACT|nr:aldose 1-epimerase family protein [Dyadobacter sp. CECT 9275]CAG5016476.1 Protein LacX, plasmid [Dyadobacter sp. CECT 9275]